jgi:hypothetical protein
MLASTHDHYIHFLLACWLSLTGPSPLLPRSFERGPHRPRPTTMLTLIDSLDSPSAGVTLPRSGSFSRTPAPLDAPAIGWVEWCADFESSIITIDEGLAAGDRVVISMFLAPPGQPIGNSPFNWSVLGPIVAPAVITLPPANAFTLTLINPAAAKHTRLRAANSGRTQVKTALNASATPVSYDSGYLPTADLATLYLAAPGPITVIGARDTSGATDFVLFSGTPSATLPATSVGPPEFVRITSAGSQAYVVAWGPSMGRTQ